LASSLSKQSAKRQETGWTELPPIPVDSYSRPCPMFHHLASRAFQSGARRERHADRRVGSFPSPCLVLDERTGEIDSRPDSSGRNPFILLCFDVSGSDDESPLMG